MSRLPENSPTSVAWKVTTTSHDSCDASVNVQSVVTSSKGALEETPMLVNETCSRDRLRIFTVRRLQVGSLSSNAPFAVAVQVLRCSVPKLIRAGAANRPFESGGAATAV